MTDPTTIMNIEKDILNRLKLFEKYIKETDLGKDISVKFIFDRYNFKFKGYWNTGHIFIFEITLSYCDAGLENININILNHKIPGYSQLKSAIYKASIISGLDSIRKIISVFDIERN